MPDSSEPRATNESIKAQLQGVRAQVDDIKKILLSNEERIRCLERTGDKTTPLVDRRINELELASKDHERDIEALKDLIDTQAHSIQKLADAFGNMQTIWKWALGIFTAVIVMVVIALVSGQAELIFK